MYSKDEAEKEEYYRSKGYVEREEAYKIWKQKNPNASYRRRKQAEHIYKYHINDSGTLRHPNDFG